MGKGQLPQLTVLMDIGSAQHPQGTVGKSPSGTGACALQNPTHTDYLGVPRRLSAHPDGTEMLPSSELEAAPGEIQRRWWLEDLQVS